MSDIIDRISGFEWLCMSLRNFGDVLSRVIIFMILDKVYTIYDKCYELI